MTFRTAAIALIAFMILASAGYAMKDYSTMRTAVPFYKGHTHTDLGETIGAPGHSGGTDSYGCHNGKVPYHCH